MIELQGLARRKKVVAYRVTPTECKLLDDAARYEGFRKSGTWERLSTMAACTATADPDEGEPIDGEVRTELRKFRCNEVEYQTLVARSGDDPNLFARSAVLERAKRLCGPRSSTTAKRAKRTRAS